MMKMKNFLFSCVQIIFALIIAIVIILCMFLENWDYFCKKIFPYHNSLYLLAGLLLLGILFFGINLLSKRVWFSKYISLIMAISSLALGVVVVIFSYHYYFRTGWDSSVLVSTANNIASHNFAALDNGYYSQYPNNVLLTYIFAVVIRISELVGLQDYYFGLIIFQGVLYGIGGYLIFCCSDMILNNKSYAVWAWIVYVGMVGMSPWVVIPYSDSVGMFVVLFCFYLYLRVCGGKRGKTCLFLLAMSVYLGYKIKPQIAIIGVAMLLAAAIGALHNSRIQWKQLAGKAVFAIGGLMTAWLIMEIVIVASGLNMNEKQAFGWQHYIMMGLNSETNGVFSNDDVIYSQSFPERNMRAEANLKEAGQRISGYGLSGLLPFWCKKMLTVYNDGTFAWFNEGEFFQEHYEKGNPALGNALKNFYYQDGKLYSWFLNISQTLWIAVLFLCLCSAWGRKKPEILVLMMAVVGLTMFELLFEARARYLFAYVPAYIMLAGVGIRNIQYCCEKISGHLKDKKVSVD